jgi:hypothetical protein
VLGKAGTGKYIPRSPEACVPETQALQMHGRCSAVTCGRGSVQLRGPASTRCCATARYQNTRLILRASCGCRGPALCALYTCVSHASDVSTTEF